jgi:hypothetical protein
VAESVAAAASSSSAKKGTGCVTLFALPFAVVGVVMLGVTLRDALRGDKAFGELAMAAMGALFFTVAGFGMIAALLAGRRSLARDEQQRQRYPSKPWMWRHDWASGRIQSAGRPTMIQAWTFALLWNLCSTPLLIMVLRGSVARGLPSFGRSRRVPLTDVARVEMPITMQANDTPYYAIELILRDGRKITAGRGIRDKREAEWLVAEIRSLLRL